MCPIKWVRHTSAHNFTICWLYYFSPADSGHNKKFAVARSLRSHPTLNESLHYLVKYLHWKIAVITTLVKRTAIRVSIAQNGWFYYHRVRRQKKRYTQWPHRKKHEMIVGIWPNKEDKDVVTKRLASNNAQSFADTVSQRDSLGYIIILYVLGIKMYGISWFAA